MEVYLNPVKYCKTPTGHPKGHPCCKIADYDDTALGTGTLTVHPWRAGPDCGKIINYNYVGRSNIAVPSIHKEVHGSINNL
jgi:hypothetical protein